MLLKLILVLMFAVVIQSAYVRAQQPQPTPCGGSEPSYCTKQNLLLAGQQIEIRIYDKLPPATTPPIRRDRTFVVVHNNEQKGLDAAKLVISENYGRLVEVVSNYKDGYHLSEDTIAEKNQFRYLYFGEGRYCIDSNRIYSMIGIQKKLSTCDPIPQDKIASIYEFGKQLREIVTRGGTIPLIIGVHNNSVPGGLSVNDWVSGEEGHSATGIFKSSYFLNDTKITNDEFVLVSSSGLFDQYFKLVSRSKISCNLAIQKDAVDLKDQNGAVRTVIDDGSMSIYFGTKVFGNTGKPYSYINIEAGGKENTDNNNPAKKWQKDMIKFALTKIKP